MTQLHATGAIVPLRLDAPVYIIIIVVIIIVIRTRSRRWTVALSMHFAR